MFIELELTVGRCVVLSDGDDSSSGSESDDEVNQAVVNLTGVLVRQKHDNHEYVYIKCVIRLM